MFSMRKTSKFINGKNAYLRNMEILDDFYLFERWLDIEWRLFLKKKMFVM